MSRDPDVIEMIVSELNGRKLKIAIEGNISSGKTTLLNHFRNKSYAQVIEEPVDKWRTLGGDNILARMYDDPSRWSYTFQSYVLKTMMDVHSQEQSTPLGILERSVYSARYCFVENLHDSGLMDDVEYKCYTEWFEWLMAHNRPQVDLIVYLRTSPEVAYKRLCARARKEEKTLPKKYIYDLHRHYERWLGTSTNHSWHGDTPVLVLDGNQDMNTYKFLHQDMVESITAFLGDDEEDEPYFPDEPLACDNLWSQPSVLPLVSASA